MPTSGAVPFTGFRYTRGLALVLAALVLLTGCATTDGPPVRMGSDTLAALNPQPPELPFFAAPPLPGLTGEIAVDLQLTPQAVATSRYAMRLLVVASDEADYSLSTARAILDQVGVPYEVLLAANDPLDEDLLYEANGDGRFQGVILTSNNLAYFDGTAWASALSPEEWNTLWAYERHFGVRQLALNSYPSNYPEDYGFQFKGATDTTATALSARLTTAGRSTFDYLQTNVAIPIRYAYTYLSELDPATTSTQVAPQMVDRSGNILAISSTSADGRERLALTFAHNPYLLHTQLIAYGLVDWVTKGVFIGERSLYFTADVDDWFLPNDEWNPRTMSIVPDSYRLTANDVASLAAQQIALRAKHREARDYTTTLAFNGEGANLSARLDCSPSGRSVDPLTSITRCLSQSFRWVNHSFSHDYFDFLDYAESNYQIAENRTVARALGLAQPNSVLVTGDVSGLGWYNPDGDGPKTDHGLLYSNQHFLDAASDLGVTVIASNASVPSHIPACSGCGIYHPLSPDILLVPRWPTNVFYSVGTPAQLVSAYNAVYGPNGVLPYWDHDLSYQEFLEIETSTALFHMITGSPYPHFFHVANVRNYSSGRSILSDFLDRLFDKYNDYVRVPFRSPTWQQLAAYVADRTSHMNAGASGMFDLSTSRLTITSSEGGTVFVTGVRGGRISTFGGETTSAFVLAPGQTVSLTLR